MISPEFSTIPSCNYQSCELGLLNLLEVSYFLCARRAGVGQSWIYRRMHATVDNVCLLHLLSTRVQHPKARTTGRGGRQTSLWKAD